MSRATMDQFPPRNARVKICGVYELYQSTIVVR